MHKILIYDDEKDILELTKLLLKNKYDVYTRSSLNDPVEEINNIRPDLILMDLAIPGTGGELALKIIRENDQTRNVKVFFFSANSEIGEISRNSGANGYLMKPFKINQLKNFIEEQLEK